MRILLYCNYRVGSLSLGQWLEDELGIPYYHEPLNKGYAMYPKDEITKQKNNEIIDIFKIDTDFIAKISPKDGVKYDDLLKFFDKVIVLYRENTLAQAESDVWAQYNNMWHQNKFNYIFYEIDDKFLKEHEKEIFSIKNRNYNDNLKLKKLKNCLHITYEEFYFSNIGIEKVEEYLGIKTKTLPNSNNKLRQESLTSSDKLKNELSIFSDKLKDLSLDFGNKFVVELKTELNVFNDSLKKVLRNELLNFFKDDVKNSNKKELLTQIDGLKNELLTVNIRLKNELLTLNNRLKNELIVQKNEFERQKNDLLTQKNDLLILNDRLKNELMILNDRLRNELSIQKNEIRNDTAILKNEELYLKKLKYEIEGKKK